MINHKRKNIDEFPISETVCDNTKIMKSSNNSNWNQCPTNKILIDVIKNIHTKDENNKDKDAFRYNMLWIYNLFQTSYFIHHSKDMIETIRQTSIQDIENVKKGLEEKMNSLPEEFYKKYNVCGITANPTVVFHFHNDFKNQIAIIPYVGYFFAKVETKNTHDIKSETTLLGEYAHVVWNEINVCLPENPSFEIPSTLLNFLKKHLQVDDLPVKYLQVIPNRNINIDIPPIPIQIYNTTEKDFINVDDISLETLTTKQCLGLLKRNIRSITMKSSYEQNLKYITILKKSINSHLYNNIIKTIFTYL